MAGGLRTISGGAEAHGATWQLTESAQLRTFREVDIRPEEFAAEQKRLYEVDVRRLMQKKNEFIDVPCPACGEERGTPSLAKYGLMFLECSRCETVYISPRPTPDLLAEYYETSENYNFWSKHIFPSSELVRRSRIFGPRAESVLDRVRDLGIEQGLLVDVGAGYGTFLEEVRKRGSFQRLLAIEPTPDLAESCRRRGLEVVQGPIEDAALTDKADVVTAFEVVEHLFDPGLFFRIIKNVLRPGGILTVTCPNIQGFDVLLLRELSATVDAEHLNYFTPRSLELLVTECGFDVLEVVTPGVLDAEIVRKSALAGEIDLAEQPFLQRVLIDDWAEIGSRFQSFLSENCLSSHMSLTCRLPD